jgi:hypothetical protein
MACPGTWQTELREHATQLSDYPKRVLNCMERANDHPVPTELVKVIISGTMSLLQSASWFPYFVGLSLEISSRIYNMLVYFP